MQRVFKVILLVPSARRKVAGELDKATLELEAKASSPLAPPRRLLTPPQLAPKHATVSQQLTLPTTGLTSDEVTAVLVAHSKLPNTRWEEGRVSGAVYHGGEEMGKIWKEAFGMFEVSNPLHADVFPGTFAKLVGGNRS